MISADLNPHSVPWWILAPQGAEAQAIAKGLGKTDQIYLQAMPVGATAVQSFLANLAQTWAKSEKPQGLLVMGVTGSLSADYGIGQAVWVEQCQYWGDGDHGQRPEYVADRHLMDRVNHLLGPEWQIPAVRGITVSEVVCRGAEKQLLGQKSRAQVVDMENTAVLAFGEANQIPVAVLRVVSDTMAQDLPNLNGVFTEQGALQPLPLAKALLRRPLAAGHLIQGSLRACAQLTAIARSLSRGTGEIGKTPR
jgi:nucleoside phosphorylase